MIMEQMTLKQLINIYENTDVPIHIEGSPLGEIIPKGTW